MKYFRPIEFFSAYACLFAVMSVLTYAQGSGPGQERYYYTGSVGSYSVQMDLAVETGELRGTYYYDSRGIPIEVSGDMDKETVLLRETDSEGKFTGIFKGNCDKLPLDKCLTITGLWSKPDGKDRLPFRLGKVADYKESILKHGDRIDSSSLYPQFVTGGALDLINKELENEVSSRQKKFISEARSNMAEDASFPGWTESRNYSIEYYSPRLISIAGEVYAYTGGAHGNTQYVSSNYSIDGSSVRELKLGDLFKNGSNYEKTLSELCVGDLKKQGAGWIVNGEIKSLSAKDISVFVISPAGLSFAFAPYAVGSYAEGPYFVTLPYGKLSGVIDTEGPLKPVLPGGTDDD